MIGRARIRKIEEKARQTHEMRGRIYVWPDGTPMSSREIEAIESGDLEFTFGWSEDDERPYESDSAYIRVFTDDDDVD